MKQKTIQSGMNEIGIYLFNAKLLFMSSYHKDIIASQ